MSLMRFLRQSSSPANADFMATAKGEANKLFKIASPLCLGYLGHMAVGTTDVLMIGQLDTKSLAASYITISVFYTFYLLFQGIILAITPIASQALGAGQARMARRAVRQGMWISIILALPAVFLLWNGRFIFEMTGQVEELIDPAMTYLHHYMWVLIPGLLMDSLRCFMVSLGNTRPLLFIICIEIIANIIINYCLIFGNFGFPEMGLAGAGISSSLVTTMGLGICIGIFVTRLPYRRYHVFSRIWRPDWEIFFRILRFGFPIGLIMLLEQSMYSIASLLAGRLSTVDAAAHSVAMTVVNTMYVLSLGLSEATTSRVGNNFGRSNRQGVIIAGTTGTVIAVLLAAAIAIPVYILGDQLAPLFIGNNLENAELVLVLTVKLFILGASFEIFDAAQLGLKGSLHGVNDVRIPLYMSIFTYSICGVSCAFYLSQILHWGALGIWMGMTVGVVLTMILMLWRYIIVIRKLNFDART